MRYFPLMTAALAAALAYQPAYGIPDLWVNPETGSDSQSGAQEEPLRTIREALSRIASGDTVWLEPGTYGAGTGEAFPLNVPTHVRVESTDGSEVTLIDAGSASPAFYLPRGSELRGLELRLTGDWFLWIHGSQADPVSIVDCRFIGGQSVTGGQYVEFNRCEFLGQVERVLAPYGQGQRLVDCRIVGTPTSEAVGAPYAYYTAENGTVEILRTTIQGCHTAVNLDVGGSVSTIDVTIVDSLIAGNVYAGVLTSGPLSYPANDVVIDGSTIAGNGRFGLDATNAQSVVVRSSIIAEHTDFDHAGISTFEACHVADGSADGNPEVQSGPARFVDPVARDWRLRFDSPCVDRGPSTSVRPDLHGVVRAVDGDLDLTAAPDIGALEHQTLSGAQLATSGEPWEVGVTGPSGGFSTVIVSPAGYAPFGATTIFGRLFLEPQGAFRVTPVQTTGGAPTMVDLTAVLDPAWAGTTIGVQALPRSFASTSGGAYSNPLAVTVAQ